MSRIGKNPVSIPQGVSVELKDASLAVKGPKGTLEMNVPELVSVDVRPEVVTFSVSAPDDKKHRAQWGLARALLNNLVLGVTVGFQKQLEINGVGFKAVVQGKELVLNLGFSHPIHFPIPDGVSVTTEKNTVTIAGIDKYMVGQIAANIRKLKKPEPYKGKGIKYVDEHIIRKEGKKAKAA